MDNEDKVIKKRKPRHMIEGVRKKVALKMGKDPLVSKIKEVLNTDVSEDIEMTEGEVSNILEHVLSSKLKRDDKAPEIKTSKMSQKKTNKVTTKSNPPTATDKNGNLSVSKDLKTNTENRILVTGIPFEALKDDIELFFRSYGEVKDVTLPLKRGSAHKHMGLAFITYSNRSEVLSALVANGYSWPNSTRFIKVCEAEDKKTVIRETEIALPDMTVVPRPDNCDTIFIGNLSTDVTEDLLREHFTDFGEIKRLNLPRKEEGGDIKGFAHITYETAQDTEKAVRLTGTVIGKWKVKIDYAPNKKPYLASLPPGIGKKGDDGKILDKRIRKPFKKGPKRG